MGDYKITRVLKSRVGASASKGSSAAKKSKLRPSWVDEGDIQDKRMLDDSDAVFEVLGPWREESSSNVTECKFLVNKLKEGEVKDTLIIPYQEVVEKFPRELILFYEKNVAIID